MKTNIGIDQDKLLKIGQILNLLLADETMLYLTTRDYHWNVTGNEFLSLHQQFEAQYDQVAKWIDEIAERARAIGVGAHGSLAEIARTIRSSAVAGTGMPASQMVAALVALHEDLVIRLRADSEACSVTYGDTGSADFLTGLMEWHEKTAWLLRAQIEDDSAETG